MIEQLDDILIPARAAPHDPFPILEDQEFPLKFWQLDKLRKAILIAEHGLITTDEDNSRAVDAAMILRAGEQILEEKRKERANPLHHQWKAINDFYKQFTDPLAKAIIILRAKQRMYLVQQDRLRKEEEARWREEQDARSLAAASNIADEARAKSEEAARLEVAGDMVAASVAFAAAEEKEAQADHVIAEAADAPAPMIPRGPTITRGAFGGIAYQVTVWKFRVTDFDAIPSQWLMIDESAVLKAIRRKDDPEREIPGLEIYSEREVRSR